MSIRTQPSLWCGNTGGSNVSPNQTPLPPSKLGGELESNAPACRGQLLPPSGPARTEGLSSKKARFIGENASQRCLFRGEEMGVRGFALRLILRTLIASAWLVCVLAGTEQAVLAQQNPNTNNAIPASQFSILGPIATRSPDTNPNSQPRVIPLPPPPKQDLSSATAKPNGTRKLPALPVENPRSQQQDFLEDMQQDSLLERRERESTPYPRPDFSTPSERVVPLPIQRAAEDFKGFEPESPGDWNLPEPRRIFPLPKIDIPSLPSLNLERGPSESARMPWHNGPYSASPQFQSLIGCSPVRFQHSSITDAPCASEREAIPQSRHVLYQPTDFAPVPYVAQPLDPQREIETYYGKSAVDTQRPWVEWWRPFYTGGMYEPGVPVFSDVNLLTPSFLVYGDYRTGVGVHRDKGQPVRSWAHRLNLDMDLRLTGTERFHFFTGPLDHNNRFTRLDFSKDKAVFEEELDFQIETAFFEGDLGAITGSWIGDDAPFDLPFTCGLVPLLYQNGIWMEDAIAGFAFGAPWKHSNALNWANYEATFFAGFNQVTSPAFNNNNNAAAVYGTAWFIEAYNGYIETDYAYLDDLDGLDRSYHNAAIAYTRRYFGRISNSIRLIGNVGQSGPAINRSADGALLLFENSLISAQPSTFVPYWNCFVGSGRPQSVARAAGAGGILRNTGINFETDGLTNYPTLNATGSNSYGGAFGLQILSADFRKQWVMEFAALDTYGDPALSAAAGPEYALGTRYQTALNNRLIWRVDLMNGWFDNAPDIYGTRTEIRWKF